MHLFDIDYIALESAMERDVQQFKAELDSMSDDFKKSKSWDVVFSAYEHKRRLWLALKEKVADIKKAEAIEQHKKDQEYQRHVHEGIEDRQRRGING